jgi:hypothetical protein
MHPLQVGVFGYRSRRPAMRKFHSSIFFHHKVRYAQEAGFGAAIVYDNREGDLAAMSGDGKETTEINTKKTNEWKGENKGEQ